HGAPARPVGPGGPTATRQRRRTAPRRARGSRRTLSRGAPRDVGGVTAGGQRRVQRVLRDDADEHIALDDRDIPAAYTAELEKGRPRGVPGMHDLLGAERGSGL